MFISINIILFRIVDARFSCSYASKPHLTEPLICRPKSVFDGLSHFFSSGVSLLEAGKNLHLAKTEKKYIDMISNDFNIPLIFCMSKDSKGFQ